MYQIYKSYFNFPFMITHIIIKQMIIFLKHMNKKCNL
jgi:hypothetical protein